VREHLLSSYWYLFVDTLIQSFEVGIISTLQMNQLKLWSLHDFDKARLMILSKVRVQN
jgi:hypothetical protein